MEDVSGSRDREENRPPSGVKSPDKSTDHPRGGPRQTALFMIQAYVASRLLGMAAKLGLPDLLADGPKDADSLAPAVGIHQEHMFRLMRGFTICGLLRHREDGMFELTALGECLKTGQDSLRDLAVRTYDIDYRAWGGMLDAIKAGVVPFEFAFGTDFYRYLAADPEAGSAFRRAMATMSASTTQALMDVYPFPPTGTVVDVGGGTGILLKAILGERPGLKGVLFDLPSTLAGVTAGAGDGISDRCAIVEGDFFKSVPAGGDLYILKLVLHNWNDESGLAILRQCRRAINDSGKLLVAERLMPERIDAAAAQVVGSDLSMFLLVGGTERTEAQFRSLLAQARFATAKVMPTASALTLIEAVPV